MILQIPKLNIDSNIKLAVFVSWAIYGVLPTLHWTIAMGGLDNPIVRMLIPRVIGMYIINAVAFAFYVLKIPERFYPGNWAAVSALVIIMRLLPQQWYNCPLLSSLNVTVICDVSIGWVDYVGSSHQWWHALVVLALYYWHNTGMLYVEYRMNHGCPSSMALWHTDSGGQTGMRDNDRNSTSVVTNNDTCKLYHVFAMSSTTPFVPKIKILILKKHKCSSIF